MTTHTGIPAQFSDLSLEEKEREDRIDNHIQSLAEDPLALEEKEREDRIDNHIQSLAEDPTIADDDTASRSSVTATSNSESDDGSYEPSESTDVEPECDSPSDRDSHTDEEEYECGSGLALMVHQNEERFTSDKEYRCREARRLIARHAAPEFTETDGNGQLSYYHNQFNQKRLQSLADFIVEQYFPGYEARVRWMTGSDSVKYDGWADWNHPIWSGEPEGSSTTESPDSYLTHHPNVPNTYNLRPRRS
jgi:hypothetical protein